MGLTETLCHYNTLFISQCSYFGVFVLMALESMIAPVPSELVMPFAGFLIFTGHFDPVAVMVASSLGSIVGSRLSYGMGSLGGAGPPVPGAFHSLYPGGRHPVERFPHLPGGAAQRKLAPHPAIHPFPGFPGGGRPGGRRRVPSMENQGITQFGVRTGPAMQNYRTFLIALLSLAMFVLSGIYFLNYLRQPGARLEAPPLNNAAAFARYG